jgi:hypothetical protein
MERLCKAKIWAEYLKWQEFIDAAEKNSVLDITATTEYKEQLITLTRGANGNIREAIINAIKSHMELLANSAE